MSTTSTNYDLPAPELTDAANIETAVKPLRDELETLFTSLFGAAAGSPTVARAIAKLLAPAASQNANFTLTTADNPVNPIDTSSSAVTATLPASPLDGQRFHIFDATGNAATHNITIGRNGKTINGAGANLVIATNYGAYELIYATSLGGWIAAPNKAILDAAGLVIGTDVQAHDADLDLYAAATGPGAQLGLNDGTTVRRGKSIVATSETRMNTAYGLLTTPDRVQNVVLPTDGLIFVLYRAEWQTLNNGQNINAAIFLGSNQLKTAKAGGAPTVQGALETTNAPFGPLVTTMNGLEAATGSTADTSFVTTGETVLGPSNAWQPVVIEADAGTYDVSVQFKAQSGNTVTVKNRKLWVWTLGF